MPNVREILEHRELKQRKEEYEQEIHNRNTKSGIQKAKDLKRKDDDTATKPGAVTKKCPVCKRVLPWTAEYFRRDKRTKSGFDYRCKICAANAIKNHYRIWKPEDVEERGSTGVKCLLWSEYCGRCEIKDLTTECWRVDENDPETHPVRLRDNEF